MMGENTKMYLTKLGFFTVCARGLDSNGSRQGPVMGLCEHNNEALGSRKSW
jgi:hypothetical protein